MVIFSLEESCGKSVGDTHIHELEQSFSTYKVSSRLGTEGHVISHIHFGQIQG